MSFATIRIVIAGVDELSKTINGSLKGIKKMGRGIKDAGKRLTMGLTLPLAAFGALTLSTAANFETSMNTVQNLTQATTQEFRALQDQARELGATTAFSATQAGQAMGFLGMAGFDTMQIMGAMPATLNLASAANMELAETADIMSNIMTGYGKDASEAIAITDIMTTTFQSANTNLQQLGDAMKFVAPVAQSLGVDIKDTSAAIGLLSNAGIQGAMAGTNLRGVLAALAKPTSEAASTLEQLKIPKSAIFKSTGELQEFTKVLKAFEKSGASTADMMAIFGRRIGPGMMAMVSQGSGAFDKLRTKLDGAGGSAKRAADVQLKGLGGQLKILKSAFEELQLAIADSGLLAFATKFVKKISNLIRDLSKVNPKILKMGLIFAGVAASLGPLLVIVGTGIMWFAGLAGAIASAGGVIALISNPIGWAVAAIMALIAIVTYMATHVDSKLTKIITYFFPLAGIMTWVLTRWKRILPFIKLFIMAIAALFKLLWIILKPILMPLANFFAWLGDLIFKTLDLALSALEGLTRIALPKWLERKIGLTTDGSNVSEQTAIDMQQRASSANKFNVTNESTIRFENAPAGLQVQSAGPGMKFGFDTGAYLPEAGQ